MQEAAEVFGGNRARVVRGDGGQDQVGCFADGVFGEPVAAQGEGALSSPRKSWRPSIARTIGLTTRHTSAVNGTYPE